jgi:hypothetical protein
MDTDARLLHQVHPAKLATDVSTSLVSSAWLWQRRPLLGLAARYLPPVVASAMVLRFADVEALRDRPSGRYVLAHMPLAAEAIRFAGDTIMAYGAWRRRPTLLGVGAVLIVLGWSDGALHFPRRCGTRAH